MTALFCGKPQSVSQMMAARDCRVEIQSELIHRFKQPVVAYKLNIPGEVKHSKGIQNIFEVGLEAIKVRLKRCSVAVIEEKILIRDSGPEAFLVTGAPASYIKGLSIGIEEDHPLGRLMDFDVIDVSGESLSREQFLLSPRKCLICDGPAVVCGRSRAHALGVLKEKIEELYVDYIKEEKGRCEGESS